MLYRTKHETGRTLYRSRPLLTSAKAGYVRPAEGKAWWATTTSVWRVDELIRRSVRDWRRLTGEDGHTGTRAESMRRDHDSVYTSTHSTFACPLAEWILLRYGGEPGGSVLDAFAGGPPRGLVSSLLGFNYTGFEIRQEQIDENMRVLNELKLAGAKYVLGDGMYMEGIEGAFTMGFTCPPYWNLECYSSLPSDLSNCPSYKAFNAGMAVCAYNYFRLLKPGAFMTIVVAPFRDKKTGELIDFPAHTVENYREVGFFYHQDVILSKNFASAAKRSTNSWKGLKLVPIHEHLKVFRKPE